MTFAYQGAYIGPFSVSVGRGQDGEVQKFRYPVPVKRVEDFIAQALFVLSGRMRLSWSTGAEFDKELGVGGSFTEDAPQGRPMALDEELTVRSVGPSAYVCVAAVGMEQKVWMERRVLGEREALQVGRFELAVVAESSHGVRVDGRAVAPGPRFFYGRSKAFELAAAGPVACAVFSMRG